MDVLMVSTFPPCRCGIGDYTADLVSELAKDGEVGVKVLTYDDNLGAQIEPRDGVEISRDLERRITPKRLSSMLRQSGAGLVHLQSSTFLHRPSLNSAIARACSVPMVTTVHDTPGSWRVFYTIPSLRKIYKKSSRLIVHSQGVSETLTGFHNIESRRIVQIPLGVNTARYHPGASDSECRDRYSLDHARIILFFGFLRPGKGLQSLLKAWSLVHKSHPDSVLVIAGGVPSKARRYAFLFRDEASYSNRLRKLARQLGLESSIVFTDYVPEELVPGLLAAAEMVVLPYMGGPSQSTALLKALSSGKPIVATKTAGFQEFLESGENAILVSRGDVESLARSIGLLMEDSDLARDLGRGARRTAKKDYDWPLVAERIRDTYQEMLLA